MKPTAGPELFDNVLRADFHTFLRKCFQTVAPAQPFYDGFALHAIAHQLERVRRGEIRRLIINLPPRSLKSISASVAFPAFVLGHDPTKHIIGVSYAGDLARKMSNDFRAVLQSEWYRRIFPGTRISSSKDTETEIQTTRRGSRLSTSVGGTLTGRGGDIIIIDDPLKASDALSESVREQANQWFINTLLTRVNDKRTGSIVIVMQRVHIHDLTGFVLAGEDEWEVLSLPALGEHIEAIDLGRGRTHIRNVGDVLWPEREPRELLDRMRRTLGSDLFYAQYQQSPVPPGGAMIKRDWVQRYRELPRCGGSPYVIQSWDTACKGGPDNDWSVCTTWHRDWSTGFYLLDVFRGRLNYPALKAKVRNHAIEHGAEQVLVEESGTAIGLLEELRLEVSGLTGVKPEKSKESRMAIASAKFESGQVFFPETASWLPELEAELFAFPGSRFDDQVDSISQALQHDDSLAIWMKLGENVDW